LVGRDNITYGAKGAGEIACVSPMAADVESLSEEESHELLKKDGK
jgi:hypothetical protein